MFVLRYMPALACTGCLPVRAADAAITRLQHAGAWQALKEIVGPLREESAQREGQMESLERELRRFARASQHAQLRRHVRRDASIAHCWRDSTRSRRGDGFLQGLGQAKAHPALTPDGGFTRASRPPAAAGAPLCGSVRLAAAVAPVKLL